MTPLGPDSRILDACLPDLYRKSGKDLVLHWKQGFYHLNGDQWWSGVEQPRFRSWPCLSLSSGGTMASAWTFLSLSFFICVVGM